MLLWPLFTYHSVLTYYNVFAISQCFTGEGDPILKSILIDLSLAVVSYMVPFCKRKSCFLQKTNMFIEYIMYCNDIYSIVKTRPLYTSCF